MSITINQDYSRFYKGTESLNNYGSNNALKKDTLVKYEFSTTDEHGNKVMDKMTREETLQAMKDIRSQYGDNVIVQFSGDGMAALIESKKGQLDDLLTDEEKAAREAKNEAFQNEITQLERETITINKNLNTNNPLDIMKKMDSAAYEEYQKIRQDSSDEDRMLNGLRYMVKWFTHAVQDNPNMIKEYERKLKEEAAASSKYHFTV